MHVLRANLRHFDSRSAFPVQQSPQMILRKRVRRGFADQCGEGGERAWIAGLSLREGVGIGQGTTVLRSSGRNGSKTRMGSVRPLRRRSPTGRPTNPSARSAAAALTQMRVPSCLLTASSRAAVLIVSP